MQVSVDVNLEGLGFIRGHCAQQILQNLVLVLQTLWKWNPCFPCNWLNMLCIMRMRCFSAHHGYKEWLYELQYPSSQLEPIVELLTTWYFFVFCTILSPPETFVYKNPQKSAVYKILKPAPSSMSLTLRLRYFFSICIVFCMESTAVPMPSFVDLS